MNKPIGPNKAARQLTFGCRAVRCRDLKLECVALGQGYRDPNFAVILRDAVHHPSSVVPVPDYYNSAPSGMKGSAIDCLQVQPNVQVFVGFEYRKAVVLAVRQLRWFNKNPRALCLSLFCLNSKRLHRKPSSRNRSRRGCRIDFVFAESDFVARRRFGRRFVSRVGRDVLCWLRTLGWRVRSRLFRGGTPIRLRTIWTIRIDWVGPITRAYGGLVRSVVAVNADTPRCPSNRTKDENQQREQEDRLFTHEQDLAP